MRHALLFILLFTLVSLVLGAETVSTGNGPNAVNLLSSTMQETILEFRVISFESSSVSLQDKQWQLLSLPREGILLTEGHPQLPVLNRSLAIPGQGKMKLEVLETEYQDFRMDVAPSKGNLPRSIDPATVPYSFADVYQRDEFYPGEIASLSDPYILSDVRGITVRTVPFAYNPVSGTLRVYTMYKLRVYQDGTDSVNILPLERDAIPRAFTEVYENHFLNWQESRYVSVNDSFGKLLVICHSSFISTIQPWVNWKRQKGIQTEVVEFSTIGTTGEQLQTYIQNRYNADTQIKYVQLVGDLAQIPTLIYESGEADPIFGLVAGSDSYPDIFIGRFSATTAAELTPQLDKSIQYERDLNATATWLAKSMGVASDQGPGDNNEMDNQHMDVIRTKLINFGYNPVDQLYDPTATSTQVTNAINEGRGFVNYCGHGSTTSWGTTGFSNTNVNNLANTTKTPLIMTVACLNGNFSSTCFAEAWLRKSNGGAVNVYASSISQTWSPPMRAQDEVTDLLVVNAKVTAGGLFYNGSCKMIDVYGGDGAYMYKTWHIFGDASLLVRTKTPQSMTVSHPATFANGVAFNVNTGVANALVAVYRDGVLYARAYANSSGVASLTVTDAPVEPLSYTLTATAHNRITYIGTIMPNFSGSTWLGNLSSNWNTASNWSPAIVPGTLTDVMIPSGTPYNPSTYAAHGYCQNLYVTNGASISVTTYDLVVTNDAYISGNIVLNSADGDLFVTRDLIWNSGATVSTTLSTVDIVVGRNMTFNEGSNVNFTQGIIHFSGTVNASLVNHSSATQINNLSNAMTSPAYFSFGSASTQDILIKGSFQNGSSQTSYNYYSGSIILRGNLWSYNTSSSGLLWYYGTLKLDGSSQQINLPHANDYLNHLILSQTGTVTLNTNLVLRGNLTFESGILNSNAKNISLNGNWENPLGQAAFTESTGKVTFAGSSGHQYCNYSETFNILEVNKASGALRINSASAHVVCAQYDWTAGALDVLTGTFTANELVDNGIYGSYYVNPNATINLTKTSGWIDLNGSLTFTNGGTINVTGPGITSDWSYSGNASITMNAGTLDFKNGGINIYNSSTYNLTANISGGVIKTNRSFSVNRSTFAPTGGSIVMYGSTDATLSLVNGSVLHGLTIDKSSTRNEAAAGREVSIDRFGNIIPITRANSVAASTNLVLNGNFLLQSGSFTAPAQIDVKGNWTNSAGPAAFVEGSNLVIFSGSGNSNCYGETFASLELNKSGTGRLVFPSGTSTVNSYNWTAGTIQVSGGIFLVNDLFDNNIKGSYILSSGTIDLTQDAGYFVDLNADLNITGGNMIVRGGMPNVPSEWAYTKAVSVTMSGGTLDFAGNGIKFSITGYTLTLNLTGGTIRTSGSVDILRPSFAIPGGTIELYGPTDATISHSSGSSYATISINKGSSRDEGRNRANKVTSASNLTLTGSISVVSGTFAMGAHTLNVGGDLSVFSRMEMSNSASVVVVTANVSWGGASTSGISAGSFQVAGNWSVASGSTMQFGTGTTVIFTGSQSSTINAYSSTAWFHHVTSNKTASQINVSGSATNLKINGNLSIPSGKTIKFYNGTTTISGTWTHSGSGSLENVTYVNVNTLQLNGTISIPSGTVTVIQALSQGTSSVLNITGGNFAVSSPAASIYYAFGGTVNLSSGTLEITNNGIELATGSHLNYSGGSLKIGWSFKANQSGAFLPTQGSVEFIGARNCTIECSNGNYFYDLKINKPASSHQASLGTDVLVSNDLIQQGGSLRPNHQVLTVNRDVLISGGLINMGYSDDRIRVGRNWTNNVGTAGFTEGLGKVTFFGALEINLPTEAFANLEVDKPSSQQYVLGIGSGNTITVNEDLTLTNGCLRVTGTGVLDVNGNIIIQSGAGLWLGANDDNPVLMLAGNLTDHNSSSGVETSFNAIGNCSFTLDGTGNQTLWVNRASLQLDEVFVQKASGSVLVSTEIVVTGDFQLISGTWAHSTNGLTSIFIQNVSISAGGNFNGPNGIVRMLDYGAAQISVLGTASLGSFIIDKQGPSGSVTLVGNCILGGSTTLNLNSGLLNLASYTLRISGTLNVGAEGKLQLGANSRLELLSGSSLNLLTGGELYAVGSSGNSATITSPNGYYSFTAGSSTTIGARYCVFEKMNANGITIGSSTTIDPLYSFSYCVFQNGASGGTLLRKLSNQNVTVTGASFPANTWGSAYNVYHSNTTGSITFENASGSFAGAAYESDQYNRVFWSVSGTVDPPQNVRITIPGGYPVLVWNPSSGATTYRVYRSAIPNVSNWGSPIATTSSTTWTDFAVGGSTQFFYRITAE